AAGNDANITVPGTETFDVTVNSKSALTALTGLSAAGATTLSTIKIGGAGALTIGNVGNVTAPTVALPLDATVKVVDASANTGGVTFRINDAARDVSVVGSSGNDTIQTGADLTVNDTISGGDGTDTIIVDQAADLVSGLKITGFEAARIVESGGSFNADRIAGLTAFDVRLGTGVSSTVTNAPAGSTLRLSNNAAVVTFGVKDANTLAATADSLAVTLQTSSATPSNVSVTSLVVDGVETLSIASTGAAATTGLNSLTVTQNAGVSSATMSAITVTGSSALSLGIPTGDKLNTVDASAMTAAISITNTSTSTARTTISGGSGNDTLNGRSSTTLGDALSGGAGDDSITGNGGPDSMVGGAGNDTITGGTGNDTVDGGDGDDVINVSSGTDSVSGGAGNDSFAFTVSNDAAGVASSGLGSTDILDGGDGTDTITFSGPLTVASTLDLSSSTNSTFAGVKNVEALVLSPSTNRLTLSIGDIALSAFNGVASFTSTNALAPVGVDASSVLNSNGSITFTGTATTLSSAGALSTTGGTAMGVPATYKIGNNKDTVSFSSGADTLTLVTPTFMQATDSFSGGSGTDSFRIENSATTDVSITAAQLGVLSSFETWTVDSDSSVNAGAAATAVSITLSEAVAIANAVATTGTLAITRAASDTGNFTVNAGALLTRNVSITSSGSGNANLTGGAGNDVFSVAGGIDTVTGGAGNDTVTSTSALTYGESFAGGDGDDLLIASDADQNLNGVTLSSIDLLVNAATVNTTRTVSVRADSGITVGIGNGNSSGTAVNEGNISLAIDLLGLPSGNVSGITQSAYHAARSGTTITATYSNLSTGSLNYILSGLSESFTGNVSTADTIVYGGGNDTMAGGADTGAGKVDVLDGGAGNDTWSIVSGDGDGIDIVSGGSGTDTLSFGAAFNAGVTVDLSSTSNQWTLYGTTATSGRVTGFESVNLSATTTAGSRITASSSGSVIAGSSLADSIAGGV
ncbi:MAG: hypothetical protein EB072_11095, partial [Betaproteobacteria bacterium]|nr:hypothetical protein [Betaproteobacteria bacterium]